MKILSLGLDNSVLNKGSKLAGRVLEYGGLVDKYSVLVPSQAKTVVELSEKIKVYGSGGAGKLAKFIRIYYLGRELCRLEKFDVITVQDQYYLALIGYKLAKKINAGLEVQVHGFEKFFGWRRLLAKYILPRADAVRCVSQRLKAQLINDFGIGAEKITVVPIYVEKSQIPNPKSQKLNNPVKNKFIFLTVGRLVPVKNIGLQLEAMAEVIKNYPSVELWIIGAGEEENNLKLKIKNLKLDRNIKMLGQRNDLTPYYCQADAFLLTSNTEGWGLAVIEAAAYGLPVIMTDVGCAGEVIKNNESGLVIPTGDGSALVQAMTKIMESQNLRQELGENAKFAVNKLPSKTENLARYKLSWQKALNNK